MRASREQSVDQRVFLAARGKQGRNRFGRMFEIVVEGDDPVAARMLDAADRRRMLAEVATQAQADDMTIRARQLADDRPGFGLAAIVDENEFVAEFCLGHAFRQALAQFGECRGAAIDGNDDGDLESGFSVSGFITRVP